MSSEKVISVKVASFVPREGWHLALVGSGERLGRWNPDSAIPLQRHGNAWSVELPETCAGAEYKYILRPSLGGMSQWEDGANRVLTDEEHEDQPHLPSLMERRKAGVAVPVFSLRSEGNWGVGDLGSLRKLIHWAAEVGMEVVQVLPMNDTRCTGTWQDSYPYNAMSAFALHPLYVDITALKPLRKKRLHNLLEVKGQLLDQKPTVDYEKALGLKEQYLRAYYEQLGAATADTPDYQDFTAREAYWLPAYAAYRCLMNKNGHTRHWEWPEFQVWQPEVTDWLMENGWADELAYEIFVQYVLYRQMQDVRQEARRLGILLKGDLPIGVSPMSVELWQHPEYFHKEGQAGAPPDYVSADGQNWGCPTYHWEHLLQDGGRWWKERLRLMGCCFDAFRIDHVLGFFRIWEIPRPYSSGMVGHFRPALPYSEQEIRDAGYGAELPRGAWPEEESKLKEWLFFPDETQEGAYHPNIGGQRTENYRRLSESDREAYDRLHQEFFYHRHDDFWAAGAQEKLQLLTTASSMTACAEDLGMLPSNMRSILQHWGIMSLEVETMPKQGWTRFARVEENPELSVDTITTHDMPPLRLWWKQNREAAEAYYGEVLQREGILPEEMRPELCAEVVKKHLNSPSRWCILAIQDWTAIDETVSSKNVEGEQINHPENPRHYWCYRMEQPIELLEKQDAFKRKILLLLSESGRLVY